MVSGGAGGSAGLDASVGAVGGGGTGGSGGVDAGDAGTCPCRKPDGGACVADHVTSLSAVDDKTCAVWCSGRAMCWGGDDLFGDGKDSTNSNASKIQLANGLDVRDGTSLSSYGGTTCLIHIPNTDPRVYCWGDNSYGKLGQEIPAADGGSPIISEAPLARATLVGAGALDNNAPVKQVAVGKNHVCALLQSGNVACWGKAMLNGQADTSAQPVLVRAPAGQVDAGPSGDLSNIERIAASDTHTCALSDKGRLYCWGGWDDPNNERNALFGFEVEGAARGLPVEVTWAKSATEKGTQPVEGIVDFTVMGSATCIAVAEPLFTDAGVSGAGEQRVYCWGAGVAYKIGGGPTDRPGPHPDYPVLMELEDGGLEPLSDVNAASMSARRAGACVVRTDTTAWCWGYDKQGQLGNDEQISCELAGKQGTSPHAHEVFGLTDVKTIVVGFSRTCAIATGDGGDGLYCWGQSEGLFDSNPDGGVFPDPVCSPVKVVFRDEALKEVSQSSLQEVAVGEDHLCVSLGGSDPEYCWGNRINGRIADGFINEKNPNPEELAPVDPLPPIAQLALSPVHKCARTEDGDVYCWGSGVDGQLGSSDPPATSLDPVRVNGVRGAVDLAASEQETCAIQAGDPALVCWGTHFPSEAPTPLPTSLELSGVALVDVDLHAEPRACARADDGRVYCWGPDSQGELGIGARTDLDAGGIGADAGASWRSLEDALPVALSATSDLYATDLANGGSFRCVVEQGSGAVYCWGENGGRLGDPRANESFSDRPVAVPGLGQFARDACGGAAGTTDQLGGAHLVRVSRAAGGAFACAVVGSERCVACWGIAGFGRLGSPEAELMPGMPVDQPYAVQDAPSEACDADDGGASCYLRHVQDLALGRNHGCALLDAAHGYQVLCWGDNQLGQLGQGPGVFTPASSSLALRVPKLSPATTSDQ